MNVKPVYALVLLGVTATCYEGGVLLERQSVTSSKKTLCCCFALLGLLPLLVFKYYNFLSESIVGVMSFASLHFSLPGLNYAIPVGISFFTFQAVGYLLDVYHKRVPAERNFLDFALFVSFFPQIVSGPISTAKSLMPQFKSPHCFRYEQGRDGLKLLLWGMFLKLALADRIGIYVDAVYSNHVHYSGAVCLFASVMYSIQIYCDFAGYSFMAVGLAKTLGFDLINNFNRPYWAASVTEFWRRWHISLTRWLTTHVYVNLGGSHCPKFRQYLNVMITFLVSGLWHGANWTFVIWGALHGVFLIVERVLMGDKLKAELKSEVGHFPKLKLFRIIVTFSLVCLAWIFFRMPTLQDSISFIHSIIFNFGSFQLAPLDVITISSLGVALPILFAKDLRDEFFRGKFKWLERPLVKWVFYILIFCITISMGVLDGGQFIYVNF